MAQARSWASKVPPGFRIAAKVPQVITHEKTLVGCGGEVAAFLEAMDELGDHLGPLLFQFPYFRRDSFPSLGAFLERLEPFLEILPSGRLYALEVRNKVWIAPPFFDLLRRCGIAYAIIDHPWMPTIEELMRNLDVVTAGFVYVRWLGDRKGIEARTTSWGKLIVDRSREMERWVPALARILERDVDIYGYFNNHYAGHAPGSIELLREVWRRCLGGAPAAEEG